ncbi:RNA polymerase sigma factor [Chitinophaga sp. Ak27]|uniref:RNA polymerase sigma factor n=1 Tax=Chitinophaga sp. Ak27 TaxID=2726116 RepID=UPI00145D1394|nr:sigma-70 family RNA polymerase sigma factor [Chitinophaga sp. Ak27]NLU91357.1 sigma-70 family RNA polymerase sigma factor [Chitinophaga sp. Ak27]
MLITTNTIKSYERFEQYKRGEECGLNYIYGHFYKSLYYFGMKLTNDDFTTNTLLQEAFLKVWMFRHRMTSMLHVLRFLRISIRWGAYSHFRSNKFYSRIIFIDGGENTPYASFTIEAEEEEKRRLQAETEKLNLIYQAISYLPENKRTIVRHYLQGRLSPQKIAERYGRAYQKIYKEVEESAIYIKSVVNGRQLETMKQSSCNEHLADVLNLKQIAVYKLRKSGYAFDKIAIELNFTIEDVITTYSDTVLILKKIKANEPRKTRYYQKNTAINR